MKTALLLLTILLLFGLTYGQVSTRTERQGESQNSAASKLDLAEAERLNASLIQLFNAKKYDEALPIAKRVLEIRQRNLPEDDGLVIAALINLAEIQEARARHTDAQPLFERALRAIEKSSGADDLKLARILDRLAVVNYSNGHSHNTERYYRRALDIREKKLGPENEEVARSIYNLAEFYQFQGEYEAAEPLYKRLIAIREKNKAGSESIADASVRYACLLRKEGREDEANELEERALKLTRPSGVGRAPISGGVVNGHALNLVRPSYPTMTSASGEVRVRILIDESGNVIRACAIKGPRAFMRASETAAYQSKFSPTKLEGKPVKLQGIIVYNFVGR